MPNLYPEVFRATFRRLADLALNPRRRNEDKPHAVSERHELPSWSRIPASVERRTRTAVRYGNPQGPMPCLKRDPCRILALGSHLPCKFGWDVEGDLHTTTIAYVAGTRGAHSCRWSEDWTSVVRIQKPLLSRGATNGAPSKPFCWRKPGHAPGYMILVPVPDNPPFISSLISS